MILALLFESCLRALEQLTFRPQDLAGIPFEATTAHSEPQPFFLDYVKTICPARGQQLQVAQPGSTPPLPQCLTSPWALTAFSTWCLSSLFLYGATSFSGRHPQWHRVVFSQGRPCPNSLAGSAYPTKQHTPRSPCCCDSLLVAPKTEYDLGLHSEPTEA